MHRLPHKLHYRAVAQCVVHPFRDHAATQRVPYISTVHTAKRSFFVSLPNFKQPWDKTPEAAPIALLEGSNQEQSVPWWIIPASFVVMHCYTQQRSNEVARCQVEAADKADAVEGNADILQKLGKHIEGLPMYTRKDVAAHKSTASGIWVTYKDGVYDITEFIKVHPGGASRINLAAGSSIEPFWNMYAQHKTAEVYELLEGLRIGNLEKPMNEPVEDANTNDPYSRDPPRHPALQVVSNKPFNAESPLTILADNFITPNELFFVRNHLPVPHLEANSYKLKIKGLGIEKEVELTLNDLKEKFEKVTIVSTIQCAGNRRNTFRKVKPVRGLSWDSGAISTAEWGGARLRDVLESYGVNSDAMKQHGIEHIQFEGSDRDAESQKYGASSPAGRILSSDSDVLLAYEMNGEPLPLDHGYPVRVILPGVVGARNVKWLESIVLSNEESQSFWQQRDYRSFSPSVDWSTVNWNKAPAIQEYPIQSVICYPTEGTTVEPEDGQITVKGYAWSGGGRAIIRVEVSLDGGETWTEAKLWSNDEAKSKEDEGDERYVVVDDWKKRRVDKAWAWVLWSVDVDIPPDAEEKKKLSICCRAVDASYNTQPETVAPIWNLRGCLCNCWHYIELPVGFTPQVAS